MKLNKSDLLFQLCAYHKYRYSDIKGLTVKELRALLEKG